MVLPAPGNAAIGEELRDEGGIRKALLNWFAAQGINPFQNPYAARLVQRSNEVAALMPGYFTHDDDRRNFINSWAAQNWGGASPGGGPNFSRQGIINQIDQYGDVNGTPTNLFRSGDSDADAQAIASWRNIANRGYGEQIQKTAARLEAEKGLQFGAWRQNNPTWSGQYADWRLGKTPVTQGFTPPTGTSTGTGFTPPATTAPTTFTTQPVPGSAAPAGPGPTGSTAYSQSPSGPQGTLTPPITPTGQPPVNPNLTTFPSTPGNPWEAIANPPAATPPTTPGAGAITNWKQLLDKYQGDRQNWGTRGFRPNPGAFNIGGISYDPSQDQVTGYNNMSGSGRVTNRGNMMSQFLYSLQQYLDQRNRGGNAAIGITPNMTDDQVARIAWQRLQSRAIGSTGFTG
jgi:hypothetical protein